MYYFSSRVSNVQYNYLSIIHQIGVPQGTNLGPQNINILTGHDKNII